MANTTYKKLIAVDLARMSLKVINTLFPFTSIRETYHQIMSNHMKLCRIHVHNLGNS